jgi:capsular exopolysaccharide synthesis family protein
VQPLELKEYLTIIRHWAWLIVLGTAVAGGTAYVVSRNTTPVYRASIRLLIDQAPGAGGNEYSQALLSERLARTYTELIRARPVLRQTIETLNLPLSVGELTRMVAVSQTRDTQIIGLSVEDIDPERAALIANTVAAVFIEQNQELQNARYANAVAGWELWLQEQADRIESVEVQINSFPAAQDAEERAALSRLETQLNEAQIGYTRGFNELQALRVSQAKESSAVVVVEPAEAMRTPIRPRTQQNTLLAAVVGAMLALGLVFLIEYLDDTVKTPEQVLQDTDLATLGGIAHIKGAQPNEKLVALHMPRAPLAEAYRVLRTNLAFAAVDGGLQTVMVTSASPSEGKSTTVANLALVMAQAGQRVILVDADLRRPTLHKIFKTSNNRGLTTSLVDGSTPVADHCCEIDIANLRLLTSGPLPPNPAELLNSQRMRQLIRELEAEADVVLFDTPPVLSVADASILAAQVAGTLIVVKAGQTRREALLRSAEGLQKTGANLLGVVINSLRPSGRGYDAYYYYRYDTYETTPTHPSATGRLRWASWLATLRGR